MKPVVGLLCGALCLSVLVGAGSAQVSVKINFQSDSQGSREVPEGYLPDYGYVFGDRGNGYSYGWSVDKVASARDRDIHADQRYDTLNALNMWNTGMGNWEIAVPNGNYDVHIVGGDPGYKDQTNSYIVEGVRVDDPTPYPPGDNFDEFDVSVAVSDGRLTIEPVPGVGYVKICFVHIVDMRVALPVSPENNSIWPSQTVTLQWLAGLDATAHDVYLGESYEAVEAATVDTAGIYRGRQTETTYPATGELTLEPGRTYYWRIDEINNGDILRGGISSFTVQVVTAFNPSPVDGALFVPVEPNLTWNPGAGAAIHFVYFGTDANAIAAATTASPEYQGIKMSSNTLWRPPAPLVMNQTYYWRIDERGAGGVVHPGAVWRFTTASRLTGGLKGEYFDNIEFTGEPVLTRIDPQVNFDWAYESPEPNVVPVDGFSVRWTGQVDIPVAGEWTFWTHGDDGVRLWVNDEPLIDVWPLDSRPLAWESNSVSLDVGTYPLRLEFFDVAFPHMAQIRLLWEGPGIGPKAVIPELAMTPPFAASNPSPRLNAVDVVSTTALGWVPGDAAAQHDVYFGTDYDDVNAATVETPGIYRGRLDGDVLTYLPSESPLQWGQTYYWRIDEINDLNPEGPWRGNVWHFTVGSYALVDDFEAYTDERPNRIFETWRDRYPYTDEQGVQVEAGNGTGMTVGVDEEPWGPERTIVHAATGSRQSLPLTYDNREAPFYSETDRTFETPQDWSQVQGHTIDALSLWFRGYPEQVGSLSTDEETGRITLVGAGNDIWNQSDQFHFAYLPLPGDGSIVVKVESLDDTDDWAKAGVMIRDGLAADAANVALMMAASDRVTFQTRLFAGDVTTSTESGAGSVPTPQWLRLTRTGITLTGEYSSDGVTWQQVLDFSSANLSMSEAFIGLVVTSHAGADTPCAAVFSNVTVQGATGSVFDTSADIGLQVNDPARLYVALQSHGQVYQVAHPAGDQAVLFEDWTEWRIPLEPFTSQGLDATHVEKMIIGVGEAEPTQPGGTGKLFVDDIRLLGE